MAKEFFFKKKLFGKEVEIILYDVEPFLGEEISGSAYDLALRLQRIFNFFDDSSELSALNKKREMVVSDDLLKVLKKALKVCELTEGQYDITLGKQVLERKSGLKTSPVSCSYKDIKIKGNKVIISNEDAVIDLGSIAKGYITDRISEHIMNAGVLSGLIDARGDLRVFGQRFELVDVQHPRNKDKIICTLKIRGLSVATSGDYNQYYNNYENSHIINKKELVSTTVVAPTLEEADVYATALMVSDKKARERIINENKKIKALTVDSDLNTFCYNGFEKLIVKNAVKRKDVKEK
ncbi:FAD:protein FMN transferase [Candidatus Woesearchaeota archaeon]|nr:MAG: FAD:protein FMN transferase [Candidatus Woesearchaeota archaeon]